ncbi:mucin-17-like isoform X2 [Rana temporaria]|uniref:mucin-17-like isoform X2 n=1 Tax=Rana temporaria TaxID=8407 RepID=UPI001AACDC4D|nr:mucin-17-like isoform X2 [Rana temporaria]
MIRFLLLLLLLPGADLVANNTDAVEYFASTTLGAQFTMAVTPKTMLRTPASSGPANKTAAPHPPPPKDVKKQHSPLKGISVRPAKVQAPQGGANVSDANHPRYQQRSSTPYESQLNSTKMPLTARSHSLSDSHQKRPVIRKGPMVPSKAKTVPKFPIKNPSARYQSLPHLHHKNVTSKPVTGQLRDSNITAGSTGLSIGTIPQRTANILLRNTIKSGQKGTPFPPDRVKQFPVALQAVTQMGRQLKEKSSNTSVLLNTLVNQNSSFLTNSLQHMAQSSNSTFTTVKEAVLYELNSLNTQDHLSNAENVTSVPEADRHNDVSRAGLLRKVNRPDVHDSKVMQELKSKVNVKIPDINIFNNTNLSLTELSRLAQKDRVQSHPELTTETSVVGLAQIDVLATQAVRTSGNVSYLSDSSQGSVETATEIHSRFMTGVAAQAKREKDQTLPGTTEGHQIHSNMTHSHKHRHPVVESLSQNDTKTISQHKGTAHDRTVPSEPNRHHQKHLHNHTQQHAHSHHKHHSNHHLKRNHVSQTPVHNSEQEQPGLTTPMKPRQSNSQQLHTKMVTSTQRHIYNQNDTHFSTRLSDSSDIGGLKENEIGSVTAGLSGISGTASPRLTTQTIFDSQSELTTQSQDPTTHFSISVTDSQTEVHKLNLLEEQGRQTEAYPSLHTKPFIHRHSESHARYHVTQTTKYNVTTHLQVAATEQPQLDLTPLTTQNQSGTRTTQEELTTPTQEQQTIKNQTNRTFLGSPKLSTSEVGLTTQTQSKLLSQTQPELSTEQDFSTRAWSTMSTQEPPNLTTKSPLMPTTVTMPYLITPSQPEPTRNNLPNSGTLAYVNTTQPEPITDSHLKGNERTEFSTITGPVINNALDSTYQTKPIPNGPMELGNYTAPITDSRSSTQKEFMTKTKTVFPTMPELITKVTTESTNITGPFLQGEMKTNSQVEPVTKRKDESTAQNEPASRRDSTTRHKPTTVTHLTTKSEWVTDEMDTQKQTTPTPDTHTGSTKQIEPITNRKMGSTTLLESTSENLTDSTDTEPITRYVAELDTEKEPTTANKMESFTQTSFTSHSGGKKEPAIQIEIGIINQTELIPKMSFKPTVSYPRGATSHKGLMQSTPSNAGTSTYHQSITWTGPELTTNVNEKADMQTPGDQTVDMYAPTERTSFTNHANVPEYRTESPAPATTGGPHGYTQNGVHYSKTTPAWDVEAYHPTSRLPSDQRQDHATAVKNDGSESPSSTKSVTSPQSSTFTPQTLSEMMSSPSGRDRIFIVDEQPPVFKVPTISVTYKVNVQQSTMCSDPEPCKKHFSTEVTSAYKYIAGFDRADVINVTLAGTALEYKVQYSVRVGSAMSVEQESVLANPTSVFEALVPSEYTLLSAIRNTSMADTIEPCAEWFTCPRGFRCVPQRKLSAFCLSPCHSTFCQNDGICIHRKGQDPACQCPVGIDFWYMGPTCDYRMTHHRLAAISCAVVFCIIICAAAAVFLLVRRFQTQILHQKVAQTQSSYRRFSRFDDVPTHFWCPSQTWLTTSASINSLDNPAFSSSEEVFPLQALGSCVCGCQEGARNNAPTNPAQQPSRAPPRKLRVKATASSPHRHWGQQSRTELTTWNLSELHEKVV